MSGAPFWVRISTVRLRVITTSFVGHSSFEDCDVGGLYEGRGREGRGVGSGSGSRDEAQAQACAYQSAWRYDRVSVSESPAEDSERT